MTERRAGRTRRLVGVTRRLIGVTERREGVTKRRAGVTERRPRTILGTKKLLLSAETHITKKRGVLEDSNNRGKVGRGSHSLSVFCGTLNVFQSSFGASSIKSMNWSSFGVMMICVRRLRCFPFSVLLEATGLYSPLPAAERRFGSTPY